MKLKSLAITTIAFALFFLFAHSQQIRAQFTQPPSTSVIPVEQTIQPAELNQILQTRNAAKPLLLHVGSKIMFEEASIPGSIYAGPGSSEAGQNKLRSQAKQLSHDKFIVLYCGCCPWDRCPNVAPAYKLLTEMGFKNVKILYIANNFGADWVSKGYPVEHGK